MQNYLKSNPKPKILLRLLDKKGFKILYVIAILIHLILVYFSIFL